mmetsp:Transcript_65486/g.174463  ORF Transcript_65486/g.174463 Transcript_65486/m.174463 type:complete len:227 (-) Transcript_65486:2-682(-)
MALAFSSSSSRWPSSSSFRLADFRCPSMAPNTLRWPPAALGAAAASSRTPLCRARKRRFPGGGAASASLSSRPAPAPASAPACLPFVPFANSLASKVAAGRFVRATHGAAAAGPVPPRSGTPKRLAAPRRRNGAFALPATGRFAGPAAGCSRPVAPVAAVEAAGGPTACFVGPTAAGPSAARPSSRAFCRRSASSCRWSCCAGGPAAPSSPPRGRAAGMAPIPKSA